MKKNAHMLVTMDTFRYDLIEKDISQVVNEQDEEKLARLRADLESYKAQVRRRCSPHYIKQQHKGDESSSFRRPFPRTVDHVVDGPDRGHAYSLSHA